MEHSAVNFGAAAAEFYGEFAAFEGDSLGMALRTLSNDAVFVRQSEDLLEFDARLDLLRRLALASRVPDSLAAELDVILATAKKLSERRSELLQAVWSGDEVQSLSTHREIGARGFPGRREQFICLHSIPQLDTYAQEARELKRALRDLAGRMDAHRRHS